MLLESPSQPRPRIIVHIDMDSFYVSVERLLDPDLIGKPVVVGGPPDSRGVVASASYEARKFGVRSAMPCSQAYRLCPQLVFVSSGFDVYSQYSRRIAEILGTFTPLCQMASQDEAYLDMTGTERLWGDPEAAGERMKERIREETGLPCTVGASTARVVSKIASAHAKPDGLLWIRPGDEARFLAPLDISRMPGIGPSTQKRLRDLGLQTLGDLQRLGSSECARLFGEHGGHLWERASGIDDTPVESDSGPPKQVSHETTFSEDVAETAALDRCIALLSDKVASRLRRADLTAFTIGIKFRYADFETHTAAATLPAPTSDPSVIRDEARDLLARKRSAARPLRLIGVTATGLVEGGGHQTDLLSTPGSEKSQRLWKAVDALREKYGDSTISRGEK